jgi:hypothetical protein
MKRIAFCVLLVVIAACASSSSPKPSGGVTPLPTVDIAQVYGPADLNYSRGISFVDAQYSLEITNPSTDPITLKHVTLESVGGGSIRMRREDRSFNNEIPPGQTGQAVVTARVYFQSDNSGTPTREPITLRATLSFNSPKGSFNRIVQKMIGQFPGQ